MLSRKGRLVVVEPEIACVPSSITVWSSLGPEGCKVESSLGGGGLEVGRAGLGSGGRALAL